MRWTTSRSFVGYRLVFIVLCFTRQTTACPRALGLN